MDKYAIYNIKNTIIQILRNNLYQKEAMILRIKFKRMHYQKFNICKKNKDKHRNKGKVR